MKYCSNQDRNVDTSLDLEPGEDLLLMFIANPRGATRAGVACRSVARQIEAGRRGGLPVTTDMVVALTNRRLLTLRAGRQGRVAELVGSVPLDEIDAIQVKRFGFTLNICVASGGQEVRLEADSSSPARDFADLFEPARRLVLV